MRVTVELRDIVSEADVEAVMGLRRGPGQDRFIGPMIEHFEDAIADARARPRKWAVFDGDQLVGFTMLSDDVPVETLAADDSLVGPFFLWRLLIDHRFQGRGYGRATIDAIIRYLRASRPNATVLWTSCVQDQDGPRHFYVRYGFVDTGRIHDGEVLLRFEL